MCLPLALPPSLSLVVAAYLVDRGPRSPVDRLGAPAAADSAVPSAELAGEWSGEGAVTRCAGFAPGCDRTLPIQLTIDCSGKRWRSCRSTAGYGSPPLRFRRAAIGPPGRSLPTSRRRAAAAHEHRDLAAELAVREGRLTGSYAESTVQSFDCGATGVAETSSWTGGESR